MWNIFKTVCILLITFGLLAGCASRNPGGAPVYDRNLPPTVDTGCLINLMKYGKVVDTAHEIIRFDDELRVTFGKYGNMSISTKDVLRSSQDFIDRYDSEIKRGYAPLVAAIESNNLWITISFASTADPHGDCANHRLLKKLF